MMNKQRFVLSWESREESSSLLDRFLSDRIKSIMESPHGMWNYMTYRDAIGILGMDHQEIYRDGKLDLDPKEWSDFGWMTCYAGPPESAVKEMQAQLTSTNINPYSPDLINPLREISARNKFKRERGDDFEVIGTEGAQAAMSYVLQTFVNPGDEVIITDPGYFHFEPSILMAGGIPIRIPLTPQNNFRMRPEEVQSAITSHTKVIIVCDPINPFGTVQTKHELIEIAKIARARDIIIINNITHNTHRINPRVVHHPMASLWKETNVDHVSSIFSISHGYGMAGVRLGFLAGHPDLMRACLITKVALTRLNTNLVAQYGALSALKDEEYVKKSEAIIRRNYAHIKETIGKISELSIPVEPEYGFSMIIDVSGTGVTAQELTVALFKHRIVVYPGDGLGDVGATDYIRLNISRPDILAFENFRKSLPDAISEAQTGAYREDIIRLFEHKSTDRARSILQKLKKSRR